MKCKTPIFGCDCQVSTANTLCCNRIIFGLKFCKWIWSLFSGIEIEKLMNEVVQKCLHFGFLIEGNERIWSLLSKCVCVFCLCRFFLVFRVAISIPFMNQTAHKRVLARVCGRARLCIEWKEIAILACLRSLCFDVYMFFLLIQVFTWFTYFNIQAPFIHICNFVCKIFVLSESFSVLMNRRTISAVFSWKETIRQMEISNVRLVLVYTCIESCKQMPYGDYFSQV